MLSATADHALRATLVLARHASGTRLRATAIADAVGAPRNYMAKTLNQLAKAGIVSSSRGPLGGFLLGTFAAFALVLSGIGIYGVIVYWVNQRRRDIGIHMALGAERRHILAMIAREFLAMIGAGLAIGVLAALALARLMAGLLFGVATTDLATFAVIALVVAAIALVATWLPAMRATRVEPSAALRTE